MHSRETQITMVKWTNAGGQTKRTNERSFVYRPPAWRRWRNVKTTYKRNGRICRVFSLTWPASMQNLLEQKKEFASEKRVQLPQGWFGTPTWPPWRHVKTLLLNSALMLTSLILNWPQANSALEKRLSHRAVHLPFILYKYDRRYCID